jgi:hypothetical protein
VGNVFIGINNLVAGYGVSGEHIAPYQDNGACQGVAMTGTDAAIVLLPLAGKVLPVGLMMAEAEQMAVVAAEQGNAISKSLGRTGRQGRLREILNDPKASQGVTPRVEQLLESIQRELEKYD